MLGQVKDNAGSLTRYYYLKDHLVPQRDPLGSDIKVVLNQSGGVDSYNDYYPFGMQMPGRNQAGTADGRFKFTGKEQDVETTLDYFGARYYDSWRGQWLSVDTLSFVFADISPYAYSHNDPISRLDINGNSDLRYLMASHVIVLYDKNGNEVGRWNASNTATKNSTGVFANNGHLDPGKYNFEDQTAPTTHGDAKDKNGILLDSENGAYGPYGDFVLEDFTDRLGVPHTGVAVHSGRADEEGWETPTNGCVRTTDDAMVQIQETAKDDPLKTLQVDPEMIDTPVPEPQNVIGNQDPNFST